MIRRQPRSTRTDTSFPYTTRVRSYDDGLWVRSTLAEALQQAAAQTPERVLLVDGDRRIDARTLHAEASALAQAMLARAPTGSVVSFMLPNWHEAATRSEEHTSELQSLMRISYAVFCLKKKKHNIKTKGKTTNAPQPNTKHSKYDKQREHPLTHEQTQ